MCSGARTFDTDPPLLDLQRWDWPVHLVGTRSQRDLVAVLVVEGRLARCWYNRRLVHGSALGLVELWARRCLVTGWSIAKLTERDLARLQTTPTT